MSLQISTTSVHKAIEAARRADTKLQNLRAKGEVMVERAVRTVEVSGSAFALGAIQGAGVFKDGEVFKVPVELAAGLLFHGLNLLGFAGKHGEHLANFGDGGFASYLHVVGYRLGQSHWGSGAGSKGTTSGDLADRLAKIADAT